MTQVEMKNKEFKGKKYKITGNHPHSGEKAEFVQFKLTPVGWGMELKGEFNNFFVYKPEHAIEIR